MTSTMEQTLLQSRGAAALRRAALALALAAPAAPALAGCGGADDSLALVGGEKIDATAIDRDPLAVLPSGVVMLGYLDAAAMFTSGLGGEVNQLITNLLPLGPESNFVPSRDIVKIYGGLYAMQGADFCAVMQGNFDVDAIRRSADARSVTVIGAPLVKTRYADNDLFTAGNVGFVVLTPHTILTGNETGMRRALDRLRFSALKRSVPSWMVELLGTKNASFALAGDLSSQPAVASAAGQLPFLAGLQYVRVIGNFQPPGVNFAGALTYTDPQSAANGAVALRNLEQIARIASLLSSWGFGYGSIPPMQVAQRESDVGFTLPLGEGIVRMLLRTAAETARAAALVR
ncbi:hypothetical protein [Sorangium cellulosum]|uniref:Secreted protein n=1 Tax=Sorangium cellulosum So0157-2 TaxID=1254432 RepID=S4XR55_SORCE|nr:hypothetical protein [Sorangium cellulosum]AGP34974.1 hypothetical protein SCE1572_10900 [Sorangium cellulosum So0157-2]